MDNGATVTAERFDLLLGRELEQVHHEVGTPVPIRRLFHCGASVQFDGQDDSFDEFLTPACHNSYLDD